MRVGGTRYESVEGRRDKVREGRREEERGQGERGEERGQGEREEERENHYINRRCTVSLITHYTEAQWNQPPTTAPTD